MKYAEFKTRILSALNSSDNDVPEEVLYDATIGALDAILPWCSKRKTIVLEGDGVTDSFPLPDDLYRIEAVRDMGTRLFVERLSLAPTTKRSNAPYEWSEWPSGQLYLTNALDPGDKITVYYSAYFSRPEDPEDDEFIMDVPRIAETGMLYWACAHCLVPEGVTASRTRQFNLKVDSGVPTDNAVEESAAFLRKLFIDEMNRIPKQPGGAL